MNNSIRSVSVSKYLISAASILFLIIFLNYANSLFSPFQYDDHPVFVNNPQVKNNTFFQLSDIRYRHFFYSTFALNYYWNGLNPFGYHLFNLLLHFLTTILVFLISFITIEKGLLWSRKNALRIAFSTSLLFALNPVHTETVSYISGRSSGLAAFFYFSSLLLFIAGSIKHSKTLFTTPALLLLSLAAWIMAIGSKEISITLPAIIILYEFCFMRTGKWVNLRFRIIYYYLPLPLFAAVFLMKYSPQSLSFIKLWLTKIDFIYALIQLKVITYAPKIHFLPINLSFDYDFSNSFYQSKLSFAFAFFILVFFCVKKIFHQKSAILSFSFLWYLITISPTNSILPRAELFNERNLYLPSFGLSFFFAVLIYYLLISNRKQTVRFLYIIGLLIILALNSALLIKRNNVYKTEISLWEDTLKKSHGNIRALGILGDAYLAKGDKEKALKTFNQLIAIYPYNYHAHNTLGKIYAEAGYLERAKNEFKSAISSKPDQPEAYINLGSYYASKGLFFEAKIEYEKAQKTTIETINPVFYLNKSKIDIELNQLDDAEREIKKYLKLSPYSTDARFLLGEIYSRMGKLELAVEEYRKLTGDKFNKARAHSSIAHIYILQQKFDEAIRELNKAKSINPALKVFFKKNKKRY